MAPKRKAGATQAKGDDSDVYDPTAEYVWDDPAQMQEATSTAKKLNYSGVATTPSWGLYHVVYFGLNSDLVFLRR